MYPFTIILNDLNINIFRETQSVDFASLEFQTVIIF